MKRVEVMSVEELARDLSALSTGACMFCPLVEKCDQLNAMGMYDSNWRCETALAKYLLEDAEDV